MASNSPSKRRHRIEPITVDELINAAGMSGYVSFLNVKPEEYGRVGPAPASTVVAEVPSTVVAKSASTVDAGQSSTVDAGVPAGQALPPVQSPPEPPRPKPTTTVVAGSRSTVDVEVPAGQALPPVQSPPEALPPKPTTTVVANPATTVDAELQVKSPAEPPPPLPATTVATRPPSTVAPEPASTVYWTAEGIGGIFPASRLRKIKLAQDALTHAEESVYDALWGVKDQSRDRERKTAMGYDAIAKAARVSKRNAAAIIQRLIQKGFIEIAAPPLTFGARQATVYRVFGYAAVLEDQRRRNRTWTIRTGNGIGYAQPLNMRLEPASTMDVEPATTVDAGQPSTVDAGEPSTVDPAERSTVDAAAPPILLGKTTRQNPSSAMAEAAARWGLDDDALRRIRHAVTERVPDATDEEIAHWIERKAIPLSRRKETTNLTGLLITAVPRAFEGEAFVQWREKHGQEARQAASAAEREECHARDQRAELERAEAAERAWAALREDERERRRSAELPRIKRDHPRMTPSQCRHLAETAARRAFRTELEQGSSS